MRKGDRRPATGRGKLQFAGLWELNAVHQEEARQNAQARGLHGVCCGCATAAGSNSQVAVRVVVAVEVGGWW